MNYRLNDDFSTSDCMIRVIQEVPALERRERSWTVFLHSANYKFSLGSGSSMMVQQIIDGEKKYNGKSNLEKAISKIKKTPICGVRLTQGGNLPAKFELPGPGGKIETCHNYDWIVHAVIPGPRIDDFETKVEQMISEVMQKIRAMCSKRVQVDFIMPVVGVNNFGYPFEFMWDLYLGLLKKYIKSHKILGNVYILLNKQHIEMLLEKNEISAET